MHTYWEVPERLFTLDKFKRRIMKKAKYELFLNPYLEYRFTKCPKCEKNTKERKHCLVIDYEDQQNKSNRLISINKTCKFCEKCQLLIVDKKELEELLHQIVSAMDLEFDKNSYFLFGTVDRKIWKLGQGEDYATKDFIQHIMPFKDSLQFEIQPAEWNKYE